MRNNFVIISHQRCGSNMVRKAISKHPDIFCDTELFLNWDQKTDVLSDKIKNRKKKKFGFLLKYDQLSEDIAKVLKQNDFAIIHLKRRNKLKMILSRMIGTGTNRKYPISANIEEIRTRIEFTKKYEFLTDFFCKVFPYRDIFYEDIVKSGKIPGHLLKALGCDYYECSLEDSKLNPDSIDKLVNNYEEVKSAFPDYCNL